MKISNPRRRRSSFPRQMDATATMILANSMKKNLSRGNQQKVILACWLATNPKLLILDKPTRGIDVGAEAEIQKLVIDLASKGVACMFISSELEEVMRTSHRVVVMRDHEKIDRVFRRGRRTGSHAGHGGMWMNYFL